MNTNALKKFAQEARRKLMALISARLEFVLSTDSSFIREKADQVEKLKEAIKSSSKEQIVEKVTYTWFNRFMALRFMDVNDYQPIDIRVLTPKDNFTLPAILDEAKQGNIPEELKVDKQRIFDLLDGKIPSTNGQNEAYKELLIGACNHLNSVFPFLFERINDYTELLLPDDLTSELSIIQDIRDGMSVEDCAEVEVIGWLYQFFISEKKDEVFASKSAVKKEDIPAATQLFTPRWIVEYMVQNTVGKLWLQNKPNSKLRDHMPYFIESPSVSNDDYLKINSVEDITLLDQACGSGHILVYGFELLTKIYEEEGYNTTEIPQLILEKNLFGFEIDERASQLASFALMMKGRSYNRRFFRKEVEPNILCYKDLILTQEEYTEAFNQISCKISNELIYDLIQMQQATNYGSLITPITSTLELERTLSDIVAKENTSDAFTKYQLEQLKIAMKQLILLSIKFHCIVDNPPYMGSRKMEDNLSTWVRHAYPNSYQDLFSCFIERINSQLLNNGIASVVTLQGWMFVSSFSTFRKWLLENYYFNSLIQIGGNSFPSLNSQVARAVTFTITKTVNYKNSKSISFDLDSVEGSHNVDKQELFKEYIHNKNFNIRDFNNFNKVNRYTFLHSVNEELLNVFIEAEPFENIARPRQGLATGCNDRFVKYWHEVPFSKTYWNNKIDAKWFPYNKGGDYRKWYGNNDNVVNWNLGGFDIKNFKDSKGKLRSRPQNESYYFKEGVTYSLIGNSDFCARSYENGYIFDVGGSGFFPSKEDKNLLLGLVNSNVGSFLLSKLNPTVNFQVGDIGNIPIVKNIDVNIKNEIEEIVNECYLISKLEWNNFEENSLFNSNELINLNTNSSIEETIETASQKRIVSLKKMYNNELKIDDYFSVIYKIDNIKKSKKISLFNNVRLKSENDILINNFSWSNSLIIDFISYAIGCFFGRYSLDKEGLILANSGETLEDYLLKVDISDSKASFIPDEDNIIPILDDEWFEDDIVGRFYTFLKASFGKENFDKNLAFVEECLGKDIRKYFVKEFYADHIKRYKKRPIYWMFSSPKGAFNVLIYMHRYTPDTLNKILNNYLVEYKEKLSVRMEHLDHLIVSGSSQEQTRAQKEKDKLKLVLVELNEYERDVLRPMALERIVIDLDDGVLVNYNKFGKVVKEVSGLNDTKTKKKVKEFDWIDVTQIR